MDETFNSSNQIKTIWLDTSALAKIYIQEIGSDNLSDILANRHIWAYSTSYCIHELFGVLKRKANPNNKKEVPVTLDDYIRYVLLIKSDLNHKIKISDPDVSDSELYIEVKELIESNNIRIDFVDAIQFILIKKGILRLLAGDSRPILVASDKGIIEAAKRTTIRFWNPEEGPFPY